MIYYLKPANSSFLPLGAVETAQIINLKAQLNILGNQAATVNSMKLLLQPTRGLVKWRITVSVQVN